MSILWLKLVTPRKAILLKEGYEGEPADGVSRVIPVGISIMEVTVVHGGAKAVLTWASASRRGLGDVSETSAGGRPQQTHMSCMGDSVGSAALADR